MSVVYFVCVCGEGGGVWSIGDVWEYGSGL